jgi:polyphosphate kinase 2 (PPK2 family)
LVKTKAAASKEQTAGEEKRNRRPGAIMKAIKSGIGGRLPTPQEMRDAAEEIPPEAPADRPAFSIEDAYGQTRFLPEQVELVKWQYWLKDTQQRVILIFDGLQTSGKTEMITRFMENMNPRGIHIQRLLPPTEREATQWYFQRFISKLPSGGEIILKRRSWYDIALTDAVLGKCTPAQKDTFLATVPKVEKLLTDDGVHIIKLYLSISQEEQKKRLDHWAQNPILNRRILDGNFQSQEKWAEYMAAKDEVLAKTSTPHAPWHVVDANDWLKAQLNIVRFIIAQFDYPDKDSVLSPAYDAGIIKTV